MISLEKTSGLPLQMREDYSLVFGEEIQPGSQEIREFSALKNFLHDPSGKYWRRDVYHIYRDLGLKTDLEKIHEANLEYDLTVIPPGKIGNEFVKTCGHYHPFKPGTAVRYPEVYEVIYGKIFWLLQSASEDLERLEQVFLISAERGQKIIAPPGFGHTSINPTGDVAVLANWQPRGNQEIYEPYEKFNGAAFYVLESERLSRSGQTSPEFEFTPNLNYKQVPPLLKAQPREFPQYDLLFALPMYFTGMKNLKSLDFLTNPENYTTDLVPERLFSSQNSPKISI